MTRSPKPRNNGRIEQYEEVAIAMAQSEICRALEASGRRRSELAKRAGWSRPFITKILRADNLTVRTLARAVFVLGYELRFSLVPVKRGRR